MKTLNLDMLKIEPFLKQIQDPIMLCDILFLACFDQVQREDISSEEFGNRLGGTSLRDGKNALMEAYLNFIPDPAAAEKIRVVREKYDAVGDKILRTLEKKMPKILKQIDEETDKFIAGLDADLDRRISGE